LSPPPRPARITIAAFGTTSTAEDPVRSTPLDEDVTLVPLATELAAVIA
jgi:hypothetical protein